MEDKLTLGSLRAEVHDRVKEELESPSGWWSDPDIMVEDIADSVTPQAYWALVELLTDSNTLFVAEPEIESGMDVCQVVQRAIYEMLREEGDSVVQAHREEVEEEEEEDGGA
jgi:hypothetical protein